MGLLSRALESRSLENPSVPLTAPYLSALSAGFSGAGTEVNYLAAMGVHAWYRAISIVANTVAKLDCLVYRRQGPRTKDVDPMHQAYRLLRYRPNDYMTAYTWRQRMLLHVLTAGNSYDAIIRDGAARPLELLPLMPDYTYPVFELRRDGTRRLWYVLTVRPVTGEYELSYLPAEDVLHVKNVGYSGLLGHSVIALARESLGQAIAATQYSSVYFRNGGSVSMSLEFPLSMPPQVVDQVVNSWERKHTGLQNAHRIAILREGVKTNQYRLSAADVQLLETRQFSLIEIANFCSVPPHKLGSQVNTSYGSLEQQNQDLLDDAIDPHLTNIEAELREKLLTEDQKRQDSHCVLFNRRALSRVNFADRWKGNVSAVQYGIFSVDEIRDEEGYNPRPDGQGGQFYPPPNLTKTNADGSQEFGPPASGKDGDKTGGTPVPPTKSAAAAGALPGQLLAVPDIRQENDYDCGAACVRAVAKFFGAELPEDSEQAYIDALGATEELGTPWPAMVDYFARKGLTVQIGRELTLGDLVRNWQAGAPTICCIQDYGTEGEKDAEESGHWVVFVGAALGHVCVMDPSADNALAGGRDQEPDGDQAPGLAWIRETDFIERWWRDTDGEDDLVRFGIAVSQRQLKEPQA